MKHVYVETNFIVDLLRPFPLKLASELHARHGRDLTLHVPWCALTEAKRTLESVIREDLDFIDGAGRFLRALGAQHGKTIQTMQQEVTQFINRGRDMRRTALFDYVDRLDDLAQQISVLPPSDAAVHRVVDLNRTKALKPFDEMVLGTVLADAETRHAKGERALYFCNLNTKDFEPTSGNELKAEYQRVGLTYLPSFAVP